MLLLIPVPDYDEPLLLQPRIRVPLSWIPPFLWMAAILYLSGDALSSLQTERFIIPVLRTLFPFLSPDTLELLHAGVRKFGHLSEYAVLASLWLVAVRVTMSVRDAAWKTKSASVRWSWKILLAVLALTLLSASLDEYRQSFVPSRTGNGGDVLIDLAGAALMLIFLKLLGHRLEERRKLAR